MTETTPDDVWTKAQTSIVRDLLLRTVKAETTIEVLLVKLRAIEKLAEVCARAPHSERDGGEPTTTYQNVAEMLRQALRAP